MPGLRSLRNRLAVIFALIIIGAIGTIYLSVTPRLEASLTAQRLDQVRASARAVHAGRRATLSVARVLRRQAGPDAQDGDARRGADPGRPRARACAASPSASAPRSS